MRVPTIVDHFIPGFRARRVVLDAHIAAGPVVEVAAFVFLRLATGASAPGPSSLLAEQAFEALVGTQVAHISARLHDDGELA